MPAAACSRLADPLDSPRTGDLPKSSAELKQAVSRFRRTTYAPILVIYRRLEGTKWRWRRRTRCVEI